MKSIFRLMLLGLFLYGGSLAAAGFPACPVDGQLRESQQRSLFPSSPAIKIIARAKCTRCGTFCRCGAICRCSR